MQRRLVLVSLLFALLACGRDFSLPGVAGGDPAVSAVAVSPARARQDVEVEVRFNVRGTREVPEVSVLGRLLSHRSGPDDLGAYVFVYEPRGDEPEDVDLAIDVTAAGASARGQIRFDFTPPALVEAAAAPLAAEAGETVVLDLWTSEPLAEVPAVSSAAGDFACVALGDGDRFRCELPIASSAAEGWLAVDLVLVDRAGNEAHLDGVPIGVAVDHGDPPRFEDLVVSPALAGPGADLLVTFRATLPLLEPPSVRVADREADVVAGPGALGAWTYGYRVSGLELGLDPAEGAVPLTVSGASLQGIAGDAAAEVHLDFEPPRIVEVVPSAARVPAGAEVQVEIRAHEPLTGLGADLQGRPMDCEPPAGDTGRCAYLVAGDEASGPVTLTVRALDRVGNRFVGLVAGGFALDFQCEIDPERIFVVRRHGVATSLLAEAGAFEPGSAVAVETGEGTQDRVALSDGSLPAEAIPEGEVVVHAHDPLGHACPPVVPRRRFVADLAHRDAGNPSRAAWSVMGVAAPDPRLLDATGELDAADYAALADSASGGITRTLEALESEADWVSPIIESGPEPARGGRQPLVFHTGLRAVVLWEVISGNSGRLFRWDGGWTATLTSGPFVESAFGLVYDRLRDTLLLHGGLVTSSIRDEVWLEGGDGFYEWPGAPRPPARMHAAWAQDERRHRTLVFGGASTFDGARRNDTWIWDGAVWHRLDPIARPPGRSIHAMAYDPARDRMVLFGGLGEEDPPGEADILGDTWEWTGSGWIEIDTGPGPGPVARWGHAMAFHPGLGGVVMHGGRDASDEVLDDLWIFDGRSWQPVETPTPAPDRVLHGMAFDPLRGRLVVQGGTDAEGPRFDVDELTPAARHLHLWARLGGWPQESLPASVRVRLSGAGSGYDREGAHREGLALRVWHAPSATWLKVAAEETDDGLWASLPHEHLDALLGSGLLLILVGPEGAATAEGSATLAVSVLEAVLDW